jgi:Relaxase/Mobilisation nuclease domain
MIIKSLSRKSAGRFAGSRSGASVFAALTRYMNRGIEEEEGRAVLWRNLYAGDSTPESELVDAFERNARSLPPRRNGNVLYHEILAFSRGVTIHDEALHRAMADIGDEYLRRRGPDQLAYGVIHQNTDHVHLHLMMSANAVGKSDRIRLSKADFAKIQKDLEAYVLEHYPELAQTRIYDKPRSRERLKTDVHEQAMKVRTGKLSAKEILKGQLHGIFERAMSHAELEALLSEQGFTLYIRGQTTGVVIREPGGEGRKHRFATLGVLDHYQATRLRLDRIRSLDAVRTSRENMDMPDKQFFDQDKPLVGKTELKELVTGKLDPANHGPIASEKQSPDESLSAEVAALRKRVEELEAIRLRRVELDRAEDGKKRGDRDDDAER